MRRVAQNLASLVGSDLVRRVIGFLAVTLLTRKITTADFGAVNLGFTVLSYGLIFSSGGLTTLGVREVARGAGHEIARRISGVRLLLASGAFALTAVVLAAFVEDSSLVRLLLLFSLSLFPVAVSLEWFFQGKEEMELLGIGRAASAVVYLAGIVLFVHGPQDLPAVAIAAVVGDVLAAVFFIGVYRGRYHAPPLSLHLRGAGRMLREALPMNVGSTVAQANANLAMVVAALLVSRADLGIFSAATKLIVFLLAADRAIATLLFPASARLHAMAPEKFSGRLSTAFKWIVMIGLPIGVGGTLLSDRIVPAVFGPDYVPAVPLFRVGVWFVLMTMVHTVYTSGLLATGGERPYARVTLAGLVLNAVLLTAGTLLFGTLGAMSAVVLSEAATMLYMRAAFARSVAVPLPRDLPKIVLAALVMGAVLFALPSLSLALAVCGGFALYAGALFAMKAVSVVEIVALVRRPR